MFRLLFLIVMSLLLSFQGGPAFASEERAETIEAVVESAILSKQSRTAKVKRVSRVLGAPIIEPVTEPGIPVFQIVLPLRRHIFYRVLLI